MVLHRKDTISFEKYTTYGKSYYYLYEKNHNLWFAVSRHFVRWQIVHSIWNTHKPLKTLLVSPKTCDEWLTFRWIEGWKTCQTGQLEESGHHTTFAYTATSNRGRQSGQKYLIERIVYVMAHYRNKLSQQTYHWVDWRWEVEMSRGRFVDGWSSLDRMNWGGEHLREIRIFQDLCCIPQAVRSHSQTNVRFSHTAEWRIYSYSVVQARVGFIPRWKWASHQQDRPNLLDCVLPTFWLIVLRLFLPMTRNRVTAGCYTTFSRPKVALWHWLIHCQS